MRFLTLALLVCPTLAPPLLLAQEPPAKSITTTQAPKREVQRVPTEDGGVTEVMQSIVVSPKLNAPFALTLESEWMKTLYDGGTVTFVNKRRIARDAAGRIYQERWALVPKNSPDVKSMMTIIQIADPNAHTLYNCFLVVKTNTCELLNYTGSNANVYKPSSPVTGPLPREEGNAVHQDLGKQFIAGVETEGTHDSIIYNPGIFGNDRELTIENEFWYSPQLGINLLSIRNDPRVGKQTFTVTSLTAGEPDLALFELPAGFKVVDHRQTAPSQPSSSTTP